MSARRSPFLLVGAGLHTIQTVGLALATDLAPVESQPKVVGLMYVMLLLGMIVSALGFGGFLADFTPGRLVQVIQGAAVATIVLNAISLWKQETRGQARRTAAARRREPNFAESWESFTQGERVIRRLVAVGLGTMAFSMEDVLLEPYGGQVLRLAVGDTTKLTAALALGGLLGFWLASRVLSRGADPFRMASFGALVGVPAFCLVIVSAPLACAVAVRPGHAADRLRRGPVRPRHADGHDESRPQGPDGPRARRLGRRAGLGRGPRDCAGRRHSRHGSRAMRRKPPWRRSADTISYT